MTVSGALATSTTPLLIRTWPPLASDSEHGRIAEDLAIDRRSTWGNLKLSSRRPAYVCPSVEEASGKGKGCHYDWTMSRLLLAGCGKQNPLRSPVASAPVELRVI